MKIRGLKYIFLSLTGYPSHIPLEFEALHSTGDEEDQVCKIRMNYALDDVDKAAG